MDTVPSAALLELLQIADCSVPHNASTFTLGLLICLGMFVSYMPQHYKIIRTGTSEGFNPWFLLLGSVGAWSNVLNIFILQWGVLQCCSFVPFGTCFEQSMGIIQITVQWIMFIGIFILYLVYFPASKRYVHGPLRLGDDSLAEDEDEDEDDDEERVVYYSSATTTTTGDGDQDSTATVISTGRRGSYLSPEWQTSLRVAAVVVGHFTVTLLTSIFLLATNGAVHPQTRSWASTLGVLSMLVTTVQYFPQIWTTWRSRTVGALSIPMMLIQTPGSFVFVYTLASRPGTNWTTWITYMVSGTLQGTLLCLCLVWQRRERRLAKQTVPSVDSEAEVDEEGEGEAIDSEEQPFLPPHQQ